RADFDQDQPHWHDLTICVNPLTHEDAAHVAILCPCAIQVWALLGLQQPHSINLLWDTTTPVGLDINIWPTVALAILWKLWDSRNARVFRGDPLPP
uniref:Reverse transcriptase zinc-binding domain-containing protein n=1 Tax=Aegilops tauschii subsp. strangulata TaxID=200361 RepID=A0A453A4M9_AEGTS